MKFVTDNLTKNESIVFSTNLHWSVYILAWFLILTLVLFPVGLIVLLCTWLEVKSSHFVVTDKRVICQTGLLNKRSVDLLLTKVETVKLDTSFIFPGRGTITIIGAGGTRETFHNVKDAKKFRQAVNESISA